MNGDSTNRESHLPEDDQTYDWMNRYVPGAVMLVFVPVAMLSLALAYLVLPWDLFRRYKNLVFSI